MKELVDILSAYKTLDGPAALATVVKTVGSAYRRPGARLLIRNDGTTVGAISGGCLEQDVMEKAKGIIQSGKPQLAVFDMTSPDDDLWGYGQGCNGVIHVFLEPLNAVQISKHLQFIQRAFEERTNGVVSTIVRIEGEIRVSVGSRMFSQSGQTIEENIRHPVVSAALAGEARKVLSEGTSSTREFRFTDGSVEVFSEFIQPPVALVLAGGGSDAIPVARLAHQLGFTVTVLDHRPAFAVRDRFPSALRVIVCRPEEAAHYITSDNRTAGLIMTHQFQHDLSFLRFFMEGSAPYVGLLGPSKRRELLLEKMKEDGLSLTPEQRARLFNPVGLDIGAEDPGEIALSIVAEIRAFFANRTGGFMKNRSGPIH